MMPQDRAELRAIAKQAGITTGEEKLKVRWPPESQMRDDVASVHVRNCFSDLAKVIYHATLMPRDRMMDEFQKIHDELRERSK